MRFIIAHFRDPLVILGGRVAPAAHCFGPFDDEAAVEAFDDAAPSDQCFKLVLPIIGPGEYDMALVDQWEREHHAEHERERQN